MKLPDRAIASYRRAAELTESGPPTWMELASLYEHSHQIDEAEELIERTRRSGFAHPLVGLVRGRILRRQRRLDEAEASFREVLTRVPADAELVAQVWGELALMRDAQGDFAGAIEAIDKCKRVQIPHERPHLAASERAEDVMRALIAAITRDDFRRWRDAAAHLPPVRTALLTGFPRSGTTLLEQVLDAHPDLVSSEERDFIGRELVVTFAGRRGQTPLLDVLNELEAPQIERERQRYFRAMEYLLAEPVGADAPRQEPGLQPGDSPVAARVSRGAPVGSRPRPARRGAELLPSLPAAQRRERSLPHPAAGGRALRVRYERLAQVPRPRRDPWREVRYEDTVADLAGQARAALETLGLPWSDDVLSYRDRLTAGKKVTSPTYEAVAQPLYTKAVGRWKHYEELLAPTLETLAPFIREFGYE